MDNAATKLNRVLAGNLLRISGPGMLVKRPDLSRGEANAAVSRNRNARNKILALELRKYLGKSCRFRDSFWRHIARPVVDSDQPITPGDNERRREGVCVAHSDIRELVGCVSGKVRKRDTARGIVRSRVPHEK